MKVKLLKILLIAWQRKTQVYRKQTARMHYKVQN